MRSSDSNGQRGASRLEMLVVVIVLAILAGILLQGGRAMQQEVERTLVAAEVMSLRTELQLAVASAINHGQGAQVAGWAGGNPMVLAEHEAVSPGLQQPLPLQLRGEWRWDARQGALVYEFSDGERVQLRVARASALEKNGWGLGGGLILVQEKHNPNVAPRP